MKLNMQNWWKRAVGWKRSIKQSAQPKTLEESLGKSDNRVLNWTKKNRCLNALSKMLVPLNVPLSFFLIDEFRDYSAMLNLRFILSNSRRSLCCLLGIALEKIKEKSVAE